MATLRIDPVAWSRAKVESGDFDPRSLCPACRRHVMWTNNLGDRACVDPDCRHLIPSFVREY